MQEKAADLGAQRAAHFFRCRTDLGIFVGAAERRWHSLSRERGSTLDRVGHHSLKRSPACPTPDRGNSRELDFKFRAGREPARWSSRTLGRRLGGI